MPNSVPSVLFIDNDEDDLVLYPVALRAAGIAVTTAQSVQEGVFAAGIRHFDAIVLAVVSPNADEGWGGCEALRSHPATAALPLIALSASVRADRANRDHARRIGCAAFAGKPCMPDQLVLIVDRVLSGEPYTEYVDLPISERC
jgi:CheY-like chemotaxis protein